MSQYPDSSPVSGSKGASGGDRPKDKLKNKDRRINGSLYDGQCNSSADGGPGMPQRTASRNSKETYDPNEDAQSIAGGKAYSSSRRKGLEEGDY